MEATTISEHYINMGRKEGWDQGRNKGREEGWDQGWDKGRDKGRKEGRKEGWDEGWDQGRKTIALNMLRSGLEKNQIAQMTALDMVNINSLEKNLRLKKENL